MKGCKLSPDVLAHILSFAPLSTLSNFAKSSASCESLCDSKVFPRRTFLTKEDCLPRKELVRLLPRLTCLSSIEDKWEHVDLAIQYCSHTLRQLPTINIPASLEALIKFPPLLLQRLEVVECNFQPNKVLRKKAPDPECSVAELTWTAAVGNSNHSSTLDFLLQHLPKVKLLTLQLYLRTEFDFTELPRSASVTELRLHGARHFKCTRSLLDILPKLQLLELYTDYHVPSCVHEALLCLSPGLRVTVKPLH